MNKNKIIAAGFPVIFFLFFNFTQAQTSIDTTVDLDVLTVPNSPALNLLGISPGAIDKPTSPNDFAISIANATNNFSQIPKNYAIEFLPLNMFSKKIKLSNKFISNELVYNILHSFTISAGLSTDETADINVPGYIRTHSGFGFRVSLLQGNVDTAFSGYAKSVNEIREFLKTLQDENSSMMENFKKTDPVYLQLDSSRQEFLDEIKNIKVLKDSLTRISALASTNLNIKDSISIVNARLSQLSLLIKQLSPAFTKRIDEFKNEKSKEVTEAAKALKKAIEETKFKRYGWLLDFAGGLVTGFRNDDFQNSIIERYALWLNGGYSKGNFDVLALARFNTNIEPIPDVNGKKEKDKIFDAGGKLEYESDDKKFSLNGEIIGRFLKDTTLYRYSLSAGYQIGKNQALTFSLGKNFSGSTQTGGNLIAALNFIKSFGSRRTIAPNKLEN